jgi:hypothetical protein
MKKQLVLSLVGRRMMVMAEMNRSRFRVRLLDKKSSSRAMILLISFNINNDYNLN